MSRHRSSRRHSRKPNARTSHPHNLFVTLFGNWFGNRLGTIANTLAAAAAKNRTEFVRKALDSRRFRPPAGIPRTRDLIRGAPLLQRSMLAGGSSFEPRPGGENHDTTATNQRLRPYVRGKIPARFGLRKRQKRPLGLGTYKSNASSSQHDKSRNGNTPITSGH